MLIIITGEDRPLDAGHTEECNQGRGGCVAPHHVEWQTRTQNMRIAHATGRRGVLTESEREAMRAMYAAGHCVASIAEEFGKARGTVWHLLRGKTWRFHLTPCSTQTT